MKVIQLLTLKIIQQLTVLFNEKDSVIEVEIPKLKGVTSLSCTRFNPKLFRKADTQMKNRKKSIE